MPPRRRPIYFFLEPLAFLVALVAAVPLMLFVVSKRAFRRPDRPLESGSGSNPLNGYWPLPLAGAGALAVMVLVLVAPGLSEVMLPIAVLALLSFGVARSIRMSATKR